MKKLTALLFVLIKTDALCTGQPTLSMILSQKASNQLTEDRFQNELNQLLLNPATPYADCAAAHCHLFMSAIRTKNELQALASLPVILSSLNAALIQPDYRQNLNDARLAYLAIIGQVVSKKRFLLGKFDKTAKKLFHSIAQDYRLGCLHAKPYCTQETLCRALKIYTSLL